MSGSYSAALLAEWPRYCRSYRARLGVKRLKSKWLANRTGECLATLTGVEAMAAAIGGECPCPINCHYATYDSRILAGVLSHYRVPLCRRLPVAIDTGSDNTNQADKNQSVVVIRNPR